MKEITEEQKVKAKEVSEKLKTLLEESGFALSVEYEVDRFAGLIAKPTLVLDPNSKVNTPEGKHGEKVVLNA